MKLQDAQEVMDCLSQQRTLFHYCHDQYATQLLSLASQRYKTIPALKTSRFGGLLEKPAIKALIRDCGNGRLSSDSLNAYWCEPGSTYLLTTGLWGGSNSCYYQTSRPGTNLVLRLNFNRQHDQLFKSAMQPLEDGIFNACGHPTLQRGERHYYRETLAWARLDVDLDRGELLIEEIQSDWSRFIVNLERRVAKESDSEFIVKNWGYRTTVAQAKRYLNFTRPMQVGWSQAMLAAVIQFAYHELGLSRLWYHTWDTGNRLKRIDAKWGAPPRSLYTRLPRQFCFEKTDAMPEFLDCKRTHRRLRRAKVEQGFHYLEI